MKDIPKVAFVCVGENSLELSGAICCAGKLIRVFRENGYSIGGCYSCISPSTSSDSLKERIRNMTFCNDVVVTVGAEGFKKTDVMPDIIESLSDKKAPFFTYWLSAGDTNADGCNRALNGLDDDFIYPSRATAVFCNETLIFNMPDDPILAKKRLCALLPSINYVMNKNNKKNPKELLTVENLISEYFQNKSI